MPRIYYIGFGVICLHAAILWRIQIDSEPVVAAAVFLVQMTQTVPVPLPLSNPTARFAPASNAPTHTSTPILRPEKPDSPRRHEKVSVIENPQLSPEKVETIASSAGSTASPTGAPLAAPGRNEVGTVQAGATMVAPAPSIQLPSSAADYLNNPAPVYPAISQRLGEQGKVVIRVLITKDGGARQAEIYQSSGFDRLDQAALGAVTGWRYVPGQRAGVPQDMWFNVPINFALK